MIDAAGNAGVTVRYDHLGDGLEYIATDASGAITTVKEGYARATAGHYDSNGNLIEQAFFDEGLRPTLTKDGYRRWSQRLDNRGRIEEQWYRDVHGKPTLTSDSCPHRPAPRLRRARQRGQHHVRWSARETGPEQRRGHGDRPEVPTIATTSSRWPTRMQQAARCRPATGIAARHSRYDARGNIIETAHFGAGGKAAPTEQGYSRMTTRVRRPRQ